MNDSRTVSLNTVATYTLWIAVMASLAAGWICLVAGHESLAIMLGINAGILSVGALLFSIRCHASRTRALLRTLHGLERQNMDAELRSLR